MLAEATATAGCWLLNKEKDPIKTTTHGHSYGKVCQASNSSVVIAYGESIMSMLKNIFLTIVLLVIT